MEYSFAHAFYSTTSNSFLFIFFPGPWKNSCQYEKRPRNRLNESTLQKIEDSWFQFNYQKKSFYDRGGPGDEQCFQEKNCQWQVILFFSDGLGCTRKPTFGSSFSIPNFWSFFDDFLKWSRTESIGGLKNHQKLREINETTLAYFV